MNKRSNDVAARGNAPAATAEVKYGIRHPSGAWFNHRVKGLLVDDPRNAMVWTSKVLADATAAMLSVNDRYEVVPLPA